MVWKEILEGSSLKVNGDLITTILKEAEIISIVLHNINNIGD